MRDVAIPNLPGLLHLTVMHEKCDAADDEGYRSVFLSMRSRFFCRYKARIGLSVCRASGACGLLSGVPYAIHTPGVVRASDLDFG